MKFETWLGSLLNQSEREVQVLLNDSAAPQFLIAWSLFESKCFDGFVKIDRIQDFSKRVADEGCDPGALDAALDHFHQR